LSTISGPEPKSDVAQRAEMLTQLGLGIAEMLAFEGAGRGMGRLRSLKLELDWKSVTSWNPLPGGGTETQFIQHGATLKPEALDLQMPLPWTIEPSSGYAPHVLERAAADPRFHLHAFPESMNHNVLSDGTITLSLKKVAPGAAPGPRTGYLEYNLPGQVSINGSSWKAGRFQLGVDLPAVDPNTPYVHRQFRPHNGR